MTDKVQQEHQKILLELLSRPENKLCADCHAKGPRWASANLGVFVCIKCSGIHRSMGTHISFVRSVSLDNWNPQHIKKMQEMGNGRAAELYEARVPEGHRRPNESDSYALEQWIRAKYEHKKFMSKDVAESPSVAKKKVRKPRTAEAIEKPVRSAPAVAQDLVFFGGEPSLPAQSADPFVTAFSAPLVSSSGLPPPSNASRPRAPSFGTVSPAPFTPTPSMPQVFSTTPALQPVQAKPISTPSGFDDAFFGNSSVQENFSGAQAKNMSKQSILDLYQSSGSSPNPYGNQTMNYPVLPTSVQAPGTGRKANYDVVLPGMGVPLSSPGIPPYYNPAGMQGVQRMPVYGNPGVVGGGYYGGGEHTGMVNTNGYVNANYANRNTSGQFM